MGAYYNENDPFAAEWLRQLIAHGHVAPGEVDTRSIEDVTPDDLRGFQQHHFFAGIGIWSRALRDAGWPDDRMVWTGSCPCQPFSAAGKGGGFADERHLWPAWHWLIEQHRPPVIFGEQVASKPGLGWFDLVSADLESAGYAVGAADLGAASVGAPHIRQRLWFVGVSTLAARQRHPGGIFRTQAKVDAERVRVDGGMPLGPEHAGPGLGDVVDAAREQEGFPRRAWEPGEPLDQSSSFGRTWGGREPAHRILGQTDAPGPLQHAASDGREQRGSEPERGSLAGFWREADWIECRDGKRRPVEPATFPLAHGYPSRVGRLRAYGNAICPQVASAFIRASIDALGSP